ncbi:MAG: helix-turn-helix domain-containing protein [Ignavibacteriaceae bacterium]
MMTKGNYIKLIFGLKLKQMRQDKNMLLSDLASRSSLSVSYLNEIESGKKYPKADKIALLADALGVSYDKMVSLKLMRNLIPIEDFLESNILEQLPLDHYGIDINKLILLMANSSPQLSALIAAFIEMAKTSEQSQNNFSRTALRTFKEFNDNYFDEIEVAVKKFMKENKITESPRIEFSHLKAILELKYKYEIDESSLNHYPDLEELRAVVLKQKKNKLLLNKRLSEAQGAFVAGKELAYVYLGIKDRSFIYSSMRLNTFDHLLNYFKASYFSTSLMINSNLLVSDLEAFFQRNKWGENKFLALINKYNATTEMFFQRITNLSTKYFGLNKLFFLRFNYDASSKEYKLSNELRLNTRRNPGGYQANEHYCRRWVSFETLTKMEMILKKDKKFNGRTAGIIHSKFHDSNDEYLCISVAQKGNLQKNILSSLTVGFQLDENLKQKIKFWNDPKIPVRIVNDTCEKCMLTDCKERVAPPSSAERIEKYNNIEKALQKLKEDYKEY